MYNQRQRIDTRRQFAVDNRSLLLLLLGPEVEMKSIKLGYSTTEFFHK